MSDTVASPDARPSSDGPPDGRSSQRPSGPAGRRPRRRDWAMGVEVALFTAPAFIMFGLFIIWPMARAIQFSLYRWKGFGPLVDFVGLKNYILVLSDDVFLGALGHNLFIVVASIVIQLPVGIAIALLLNRKMRFQGVLRTVVFVPYILAEVIAGVIWFQLLQPRYGVIDTILEALGLHGPANGWLGTPKYALWTVMVVLTWKYLGLAIILFLAGLQSIPEELDEAAQIDGASWWQTQRSITIPLLGPTLRTWGFLSMVGSLQLFDMVWILTKGGPANATTTMATFLINEGTKRSNYGIAGAASVVLFFVALVLALTYQRFILKPDNPVKPRKVRR